MTKAKKQTRTLVGHVGVDTGTIYIGDPCNVIPEGPQWDAFLKARQDSELPQPTGPHGVSLVSGTGGDGLFPVYAEIKDGRVLSLTISFDTDQA